MNVRRTLTRWTSTVVMLVFGLSLFSFAPLASAANPLIQNVTIGLDPFHSNIPNQSAVVYIDYDYNTGGYPTGAVLEQIRDASDNVVYEFGDIGTDDRTTGSYQHTWDGTVYTGGSSDGEYVPDGTYTLYLYSETPTPPAAEYTTTFEVENTVIPEVELISTPPSIYYTPSGDYEVNYSLALNSASMAIVRLTIEGPLNNSPQQRVIATPQNADGNYVIDWDGLFGGNPADPGEYSYVLNAEGSVDGFGVPSDDITGNFTVSNDLNPQPALNTLTASPDPYDPDDGLVSLTYTLSGSLGNTAIEAEVYDSDDPNTPLKEWSLTGQGNGSNSLNWNGENMSSQQVEDGSYVFKVWGSDGSFSVVPQQVSFDVETADPTPTPTPSGDDCAGYSDVDDNHSSCDAIEYVQSIGAMTGHPDGTFGPEEILQRDQVAKISLETFGLFNDSSDYCDGSDPFPDVTSSEWSYQYICRGVDLDMITGYQGGSDAGYYRPARSVNRVEFLALILRNLNENMPSVNSTSYNDVEAGEWYSGYAKYSYDHSLFVGNNLKPTSFTSRVEVAEVLYKLHNQGKI